MRVLVEFHKVRMGLQYFGTVRQSLRKQLAVFPDWYIINPDGRVQYIPRYFPRGVITAGVEMQYAWIAEGGA